MKSYVYMKRMILSAIMLCLFLVVFVGCGNGGSCLGCIGCSGIYDELDCATVLRLRTEYRNQTLNEIGWQNADELALDDIRIVSYHGVFGGHWVFSMDNSLPREMVNIFIEIAGYTFRFVGNDSGLYVYDAPHFITLSRAFEKGLISKENISAIWHLVSN